MVDRFPRAHERGSSHGTERIFRYAYTEPEFVELARDARPRWAELEARAGEQLLFTTGGIDYGSASHLDALAAALRAYDVPCELLDEQAARARVPGVRVGGGALWQPDGAVIHADRALGAFRRVAKMGGATFLDDDAVRAIELPGDATLVSTESGRTVRAEVVVVTVGAWSSSLLDGLVPLPPITVTQEQVAFFSPRGDIHAMPTFIADGAPPVYGLVTPDGLVKVAEHGSGPVVDPDTRSFDVEPVRMRALVEWVAAHVPGVEPDPVGANTCLYASTSDERFVLERVGPIVVCAGLGGHGFKFLPSIGARLADLADASS